MKTLYLECKMGIAGDMLMGALYELVSEEEKTLFQRSFDAMGLNDVVLIPEESVKCGIKGTHMRVLVDGEEEGDTHHQHENEHHHNNDHHHHNHSTLSTITDVIEGLNVVPKIKDMTIEIYGQIAEAESRVHNKPVDEIHFHEVGCMDAVADIVGSAMLLEMINPDKIIFSPINLGSGTVKCAHGELPVPTPATAIVLCNVPAYESQINGELCTPTGAALAKYFALESESGHGFGQMPCMRIQKTGYGMGTKNFSAANCLRAFIGFEEDEEHEENEGNDSLEDVLEISCNIDDMTGEELGFAMEKLFSEGALDVWFENIIMKKSRPGIKLMVLTPYAEKDRMIKSIFKHTTSIGVRLQKYNRVLLNKKTEILPTEFGGVRIKISEGFDAKTEKLEFDDIRDIALKNNLSLRDVKKKIHKEE